MAFINSKTSRELSKFSGSGQTHRFEKDSELAAKSSRDRLFSRMKVIGGTEAHMHSLSDLILIFIAHGKLQKFGLDFLAGLKA